MSKILMRSGLAMMILASMAVVEKRAEADVIVYATESDNGANNSTFGKLDLTTGAFSAIGNMSISVDGLTAGANGTLYAAASNGFLYTVTPVGGSSQFGTVSVAGGYFALAYAGASGFYAANINVFPPTLNQISPSGTSASTIGSLPTDAGSGALAFGPNGTLYYNGDNASGVLSLYSINTTTGAATQIGSGLGTFNNDGLTLVNAGGQLYGIDTDETFGSGPINIYTINTTTGAATATGATVSGLPTGYTLDTAAPFIAAPEPSTLTLAGITAAVGLAARVLRRRRAS